MTFFKWEINSKRLLFRIDKSADPSADNDCLSFAVLRSCLSCHSGYTSYPFQTSKHPPKYYSIGRLRLLHSPPKFDPKAARAAVLPARRPIWRFCNQWDLALRPPSWLGYGLGPQPISKAAHGSRTPLAGAKRKIGRDQYSKFFDPL